MTAWPLLVLLTAWCFALGGGYDYLCELGEGIGWAIYREAMGSLLVRMRLDEYGAALAAARAHREVMLAAADETMRRLEAVAVRVGSTE